MQGGRGRAQKASHEVPIYTGDDSRRLIPETLVKVLTLLIDETEWDPPSKAELRSVRTRVCKLYRIPDPMGRANDSDVAQGLEDDDGIPIDA